MKSKLIILNIALLFLNTSIVAQNLFNLGTTDSLHLTGIDIDHKNQIAYFGAPINQEIVEYDLKTKRWSYIKTKYSNQLNPVGVHFKNDLLYVTMNQNTSENQISAFVVIDTKTNKVIRQYETKPTNKRNQFYHIAVDNKGIAYISNIHKSSIYTVNTLDESDSLKVFINDESLGWIHGIDISDDQSKLFITGYVGGIQIYDLNKKALLPLIDKVKSDNDQIKYHKGSLYALGGNFFKKYSLNSNETDVVKVDTLIANHSYFNDPRHFVIHNDIAHILTNNGFKPFDYRNGRFSRKDTLTDSYILKYNLHSSKKKYTYKKGVLVTHWTGCVASKYLGQSNVAHTYGASWFDEEDVEWIANHGFDHLQIDVDVRWWFSDDKEENKKNIATYRKAIEWANNNGLGVILVFDVHPFGEQPDPMDESILKERTNQWKQISEYFLDIKDGLRFHSGDNEIPLTSNPNKKYQAYYNAIRNVDKDRFFYIPVPIDIDTTKITEPYIYNPKGATFEHISYLDFDIYDKNVGVSFTYFEPEVFIYQRKNTKILFPGKLPDFTNIANDTTIRGGEKYLKMAKPMSNKTIRAKDIDLDFKNIASQMNVKAKNREVYLGRFGISYELDSKSSINYIRTIKNAAEKNNMSWCIYDYESGRAIRNSQGNPNPAYQGLELEPLKNKTNR